jgi:hypothetical protein
MRKLEFIVIESQLQLAGELVSGFGCVLRANTTRSKTGGRGGRERSSYKLSAFHLTY